MLLNDPVTAGIIAVTKFFSRVSCALLSPSEHPSPVMSEVIRTDVDQAMKGIPGTYRAHVLYDGAWGEIVFGLRGEKDHEKVALLEYYREGRLSWKPEKLSLPLYILLRTNAGSFCHIKDEELRMESIFMADLLRAAFRDWTELNDAPYVPKTVP